MGKRKFCSFCGSVMDSDAEFCSNCGAFCGQQNPGVTNLGSNASVARKGNSKGTVALVFGILSLVFSGLFGIVLSVLTFVFANQAPKEDTLAKTGRLLASIGIGLSVVVCFFEFLYLYPYLQNLIQSLLQSQSQACVLLG